MGRAELTFSRFISGWSRTNAGRLRGGTPPYEKRQLSDSETDLVDMKFEFS